MHHVGVQAVAFPMETVPIEHHSAAETEDVRRRIEHMWFHMLFELLQEQRQNLRRVCVAIGSRKCDVWTRAYRLRARIGIGTVDEVQWTSGVDQPRSDMWSKHYFNIGTMS